MVKIAIVLGPNDDYNAWLETIVELRDDCTHVAPWEADLIVMIDPKEGEVEKAVREIGETPILVLLTLTAHTKLLSVSSRVLREGRRRIRDVIPAPFGAGTVMDVILKAASK